MHENIVIMLATAFVTIASPGPSILLIARTTMQMGRHMGIILVCGTVTGSAIWSVSTAFGLVTVMMSHSWFLEIIRYCGAFYLLYLAYGSAIATIKGATIKGAPPAPNDDNTPPITRKRAYITGLLVHLSNPKVIIFYMSLYAIALTGQESMLQIATIVGLLLCVSASVLFGYALLFSLPHFIKGYQKSHRYFNGVCTVFFMVASYTILSAQLT